MEHEALIAWGREEHAARLEDLKDRSEAGLARAQAAAKARRKAAGLTVSEAATAIRMAATERRGR
jgi:hypothetical protein